MYVPSQTKCVLGMLILLLFLTLFETFPNVCYFFFFCMLLPLFQIKNFLLSFPPIHNMTSPVIFISIAMLLKVSMSFKIHRFCWEFIQDVLAWVHVCAIHVILLHSDDDQMKTVKYTVKPALLSSSLYYATLILIFINSAFHIN